MGLIPGKLYRATRFFFLYDETGYGGLSTGVDTGEIVLFLGYADRSKLLVLYGDRKWWSSESTGMNPEFFLESTP